MRLVVDASVAVKWFTPEVFSDAAERLLLGDQVLAAPDFLLIEAANTFWKKVVRGQMDPADADEAMASLSGGDIELLPSVPLLGRARMIAHAINHPIYDCVYLAAAEAMQCAMVTADRRFFDHLSGGAFGGKAVWIEGLRQPD